MIKITKCQQCGCYSTHTSAVETNCCGDCATKTQCKLFAVEAKQILYVCKEGHQARTIGYMQLKQTVMKQLDLPALSDNEKDVLSRLLWEDHTHKKILLRKRHTLARQSRCRVI